jgi:hypothetical protein
MGATKIMIIRHAEKPGSYNQKQYFGVDMLGKTAGANEPATPHRVAPSMSEPTEAAR